MLGLTSLTVTTGSRAWLCPRWSCLYSLPLSLSLSPAVSSSSISTSWILVESATTSLELSEESVTAEML